MDTVHQLRILLIILGVVTIIAQSLVVLTAPIGHDMRQTSESSSSNRAYKETGSSNSNNSKDDICVNKGKFCEIICKNNPSEGGKMCK